MDRLDLLKELDKLAIVKSLDNDEIRLFLLLLANCSGSQKDDIEYLTIKRAIGREFTRSRLESACQRLFHCKLITEATIKPVGASEEDYTLSYMIAQPRVN